MVRNDYSCVEVAVTKWGTLTLALVAVTSLALRYVTEPMTCHIPAQFTDAHAAYAQQTCFQKQFIYLPISTEHEVIPSDEVNLPSNNYTYHQWVPFFLGVAAILCLLPHVIWRMLSGFLWLDAHALLRTIADNQRQNGAGRHVAIHDSALLLQAGLKGGNNMLSLATLGRKVLVGAVCLVQAILMAVVFSPNLSVPGRNSGEEEVGPNGSIPLPLGVILCDYAVRNRGGSMSRYTLECIMPLAQVYSKGLTFFFYFFFVLFLLSALDVITWAGRVLIPGLRDVNLQRYVSAISQSETIDSQRSGSAHFFQSLGLDGRLVLAMTADYCGPLAAADLTNHLWLICKGTPRPCPVPSGTAPAPGASGNRGDPGAIPMVTIGDNDGDALVNDGKTEKA